MSSIPAICENRYLKTGFPAHKLILWIISSMIYKTFKKQPSAFHINITGNKNMLKYCLSLICIVSSTIAHSETPCINKIPIYQIEDSSHNISFLFPTTHYFLKSTGICPFPDGTDEIIRKTNSLVIERYDLDPAAPIDENQEELNALYKDVDPNLWTKIVYGDPQKPRSNPMQNEIDRLYMKRNITLRNEVINEIKSEINDLPSIIPDKDKEYYYKALNVMKPEGVIYYLMNFVPSKIGLELMKNEDISLNSGQRYGHERLLIEKMIPMDKSLYFIEKPAEIIYRIRDALHSDENRLENSILTTIDDRHSKNTTNNSIAMVKNLFAGKLNEFVQGDKDKSDMFMQFVNNPIAREREKHWAPRIKEMMKSEKCPCLFAVGAMHVIDPNYLRKSLLENGISSKQINLPDDK